MIKHKNRIKHDPEAGQYGDCHRACVATILGLDPDQVPHFYGNWDQGEGEALLREFLGEFNLVQYHVLYTSEATVDEILRVTGAMGPGVPMILGGLSSAGVGHSVVLFNGEIYNDPSGSGIVGPLPDGFYWVTVFVAKPNILIDFREEIPVLTGVTRKEGLQ